MSALTWKEFEPLFYSYGASIGLAVLNIVIIIVVGWVVSRFVRRGLMKLELLLGRVGADDSGADDGREKRVRTLVGLLRTIASVAIWATVTVVCLTEVGVDIGPILAGAGILGLAIGFGAQNLVKDIISGFFIILENQIRVGDVGVINGTGGLVESITYRTIIIRDLSGVVHVFPNGSINTLSNMTKGWSAYVIDVGIAYEQDIDEAVAAMKEVHEGMSRDQDFSHDIISPIEVFGVDEYGDSQITIKARLKTRPIRQWAVGRDRSPGGLRFGRRIPGAGPDSIVEFAGAQHARQPLERTVDERVDDCYNSIRLAKNQSIGAWRRW